MRFRAVTLLVLCVALSVCAWAQGSSATLLGTVADTSGAAIPAAAVEAKNVGTGVTQTVTADDQGRFRIPDINIGDYEVQASKAGFQTVVRKGVTLTVGSQAVVDFALPVGQQQQTVTVEGQASTVETTNAAIGTSTSEQQMRELPLNGRNFEQLIQLAPGVATVQWSNNAMQGRAAQYSVAGGRPEGQAIMLDDENLQSFWNNGIISNRPAEGDVLYFPLTKSFFEIKFVDHQKPFYQLTNVPVYKLQVELMEYNNESVATGVAEVDQLQRQFATEYVFDIEWIDTVRSAIPGSVASGMCSPS